MRRPAKIGLGLGVAAGVYLLGLLIAGGLASGLIADRVQSRLAEGFDAEAKVGGASVSLVTGSVTLSNVEVTRDVIDHLGLTVPSLEIDIAPLGAVVFDRAPRRVRIRGGRLVLTGAGALALPHRVHSKPIRVGALELDDIAVDLMATGYWPGLARIVITIERARSGPTTLRTGLSWLFTLEELVARVDLPAGIAIRLSYGGGVLAVSGAFFGQTPVVIPFTMPSLDGSSEVQQLVGLGKELGKRLAVERARRWLYRYLAR